MDSERRIRRRACLEAETGVRSDRKRQGCPWRSRHLRNSLRCSSDTASKLPSLVASDISTLKSLSHVDEGRISSASLPSSIALLTSLIDNVMIVYVDSDLEIAGGFMASRRLLLVVAVLSLLFVSLPAHAQFGGCGLSAEFADPCDLDQGGDPVGGGGPMPTCQRCVIGLDGLSYCKDSRIYSSQWPEYYACSPVSRCYYDALQGWYCEPGCAGSPCYSV